MLSRHRLLHLAAGGGAATLAGACGTGGAARPERTEARRAREDDVATQGRLTARPQAAPSRAAPPARGLHPLPRRGERAALLYVPKGYAHDEPHALVVMLHGAGGGARNGVGPLLDLADEYRLLLLAPASRASTWDVIVGGYGPDVAALDAALRETVERCAVDSGGVAVGGFSDGASYALSLGLTNGDLFRGVLAFSPGFSAPAAQRGSPRVFVSHGTDDPVLPIERTSRRIVPTLRRAGYDVRYREFAGGHTVPAELAREGLEWLL